MRRAAFFLVLLAVLASGCGGGSTDDPGRDVVAKLIDAAKERDAGAMWELLSESSKRRAGPTEEAFAAKGAKTLERELAPFANGFRVSVSELVTDRFGVVAIEQGKAAYGVPLRLEGDDLKVELPGPVTIEVLGPRPGSHGPVGQVGVGVRTRGGVGNTALYVDGSALDARSYSGPEGATVFANLGDLLPAGRHTAVAYADLGDSAAARAWTFTAR